MFKVLKADEFLPNAAIIGHVFDTGPIERFYEAWMEYMVDSSEITISRKGHMLFHGTPTEVALAIGFYNGWRLAMKSKAKEEA